MSDDKLVKEIRPVAVPAHFLLVGSVAAGFLSIFPSVGTFVVSAILKSVLSPSVSMNLALPFLCAAAVYAISFAVIIFLTYLKVFKEPGRTSYAVFTDRLEYQEGLLARHWRTVMFDQIVDVSLSEGLLQQPRGVGTVVLTTQQLVSSGEGKLSNRTVSLTNVPRPREVYELLCSLAQRKSTA